MDLIIKNSGHHFHLHFLVIYVCQFGPGTNQIEKKQVQKMDYLHLKIVRDKLKIPFQRGRERMARSRQRQCMFPIDFPCWHLARLRFHLNKRLLRGKVLLGDHFFILRSTLLLLGVQKLNRTRWRCPFGNLGWLIALPCFLLHQLTLPLKICNNRTSCIVLCIKMS